MLGSMKKQKHSKPLSFKRIQEWPSLIYRSNLVSIPGIEEKRYITVYLPPKYWVDESPHPVAFFFDGQNLFEDEGTMAGGWHMHTVLDQRAKAKKKTPIVVGIHHGLDRDVEMCPWEALPGSGKPALADKKLAWLMQWLYPKLCEKLNIQKGPENTLVGGSSLGGFLALYAFFEHPQFFGKVMAMSPSIWVGMFEIFPYLLQKNPKPSGDVYFDIGLNEAEGAAPELGEIMRDQLKLLKDALHIFGYLPGQNLHFIEDSKGRHNEQDWRRRLPKAFDLLMGDKPGV